VTIRTPDNLIIHNFSCLLLRKSYTQWFSLLVILFILFSCSKDPIRETEAPGNDPPPTSTSYENGIFVINEGNFNWGNASVTFIDDTSNQAEQNIFEKANERGLGDVAQSMKIYNDLGLIAVNNSNRIEVVSLKDFKLVKSITDIPSPRYIEIVDPSKAYVTSLQKNITVISLTDFSVQKVIPTPTWTEGLVRYDHFLFVTSVGKYFEPNSTRKAQVLVIDTKNDVIIDSIFTGKEPLGIVIDKKQKIWILCTGGYDFYEAPRLIRMDPLLRMVEQIYIFPNSDKIPKRLCINPGGDTLYFLTDAVYQMPVTASDLPAQPLIESLGRSFYGLAVHPKTGTIYVTDVLDYIQNGKVYEFRSSDGTMMNSYDAGRIPGSFCFTPDPARQLK